MTHATQPGRGLLFNPGQSASSSTALPFPCQAVLGEERKKMAQNCSPNSHVAHGTQHGWVLFGLEVDPDVEKGRRTRRRDAMEQLEGRWDGGSRQWEEGE